MRLGVRLLFALLLVGLFTLMPTLARWYTDWLWFGEVGYRRVFWVPLLSRIGVTVGVGGILFLLLYLNVLPLLRRMARPPDVIDLGPGDRGRFARRLSRRFGAARVAATVIGVVALLVGIFASDRWTMFQQYVHAVAFGAADPLFGKDVGFFMFRLPVYQWAASFLFSWLVIALIVLLLLVRGWGFWLDAYGLVYSPTGVVTGAGYTDVHVVLPALRAMAVLFGLAALLMFANVRLRTMRFAVAVVLVTIAAWFFGLRLLPGVVQTLRVRPSELTPETPYIQPNIQGTRAGSGLAGARTG